MEKINLMLKNLYQAFDFGFFILHDMNFKYLMVCGLVLSLDQLK